MLIEVTVQDARSWSAEISYISHSVPNDWPYWSTDEQRRWLDARFYQVTQRESRRTWRESLWIGWNQQSIPPVIPSDIRMFLDDLCMTEEYDEDLGCHFWLVPHPFTGDPRTETGICTNGAALVAKRFGGRIMGYRGQDNPTAKIGHEIHGGHDFAIVGNWLIDWWARHFAGESKRDIFNLTLDADLIRQLYGDPAKWTPVPLPKFWSANPFKV